MKRKEKRRIFVAVLVLFSVFLFGQIKNDTYAQTSSNDVSGEKVFTLRLGGTNRYETAVKISQAGYEDGASNVVIATGSDYPDAISAAPLAEKYDGPILLTEKDSLPQIVVTELKRLNVKHAFLTGGVGVISLTVEKQLSSMGIVTERLGGNNRYETSIKIAEKLGTVSGSFIVTNGEKFEEALSISPIAAQKSMPIILVGKDTLNEATKAFINKNKFSKTYVLGGTSLISDAVVKSLPNPERIDGKDVYERNSNIIKKFEKDIDFTSICIATGKNFPDALAGSVLAGQISAPIIFLDSSENVSSNSYLSNKIGTIENICVFGGENVVSSTVVKNVFEGGTGSSEGSGNYTDYKIVVNNNQPVFKGDSVPVKIANVSDSIIKKSKFELYVDGKQQSNLNWDTSQAELGSHALQIKMNTTDGNTVTNTVLSQNIQVYDKTEYTKTIETQKAAAELKAELAKRREFLIGDVEKNGSFAKVDGNWQFTSEAAKQENIETVTVNVWDYVDKNDWSKGKNTVSRSIQVNKRISGEVKQIFDEIYALPQQFPIKDVGGLRDKDPFINHPAGSAIDINPDENYYIEKNSDGTVKEQIGKYYKPNEDPYSITTEVVQVFENHKWDWLGSDKWKNPKDYMHFSYLGG